VANGPVAAVKELISAPVTAAANHEAKAADQASGGSGRNQQSTTTVAGAQRELGIHNLESGFAPPGGGAKLTDPNRDPDQGGKPTEAQLAFIHALNEATHTGPEFHNPGNVDPGPDGDQSGLATGPVSGTTLRANTGVTGENTKLGDPGNPNTGEQSPAGGQLSGSLPGHAGGTPGDAQGGIIQDDGNATHGNVHETGPGNEHFGPGSSLGATPPTPSHDDSSSSSTDSSAEPPHLAIDPALLAELEQRPIQDPFTHHDDD